MGGQNTYYTTEKYNILCSTIVILIKNGFINNVHSIFD